LGILVPLTLYTHHTIIAQVTRTLRIGTDGFALPVQQVRGYGLDRRKALLFTRMEVHSTDMLVMAQVL
jgi:hypothetical protein